MIKLSLVAGARPNFMKIAPLIRAIKNRIRDGAALSYRLVHTGQHYDKGLSDSFFEDLGIPAPDINLESGSGTHSEQTAQIMVGFENELRNHSPDLVIVVGDVNSTLACSIVSKKMGIKVAHVEGGIRSGDWKMPEEINRRVTDSISDYFFTTTKSAGENLVNEGVSKSNIFLVGNTMIDTLIYQSKKFTDPKISPEENYLVLTLHRPSNVDNPDNLINLLERIKEGAPRTEICFPVHPRTAKILDGITKKPQMRYLKPLGYNHFLYLVKNSIGVITDSGGIQEETSFLGIPCLTLRDTTERPETVEIGTNILIGDRWNEIAQLVGSMVKRQWKSGRIPELWDGKTSERIVDCIIELV